MKHFALALAFAVIARADLVQSASFSEGTYLSLDTGQTTSSPGPDDKYDIRWTGGTIVPAGTAKLVNVGIRTPAQFDLLTQSDVRQRLSNSGNTTPIPAGNLITNDVFYVLTNFGNPSKIIVTSKAGGLLTVNFVTYQSVAPGAPKITGVLNNSSRIPDGLPNSGIAPSSIFIVKGTDLADAGNPELQSSAPPGIPLTFHGASITVTVSGVTTNPALYYTSPTQLAAVLPANTPVGTGTLTVTHNGLTSAPFTIHVVSAAPGLNVYGTNTGVATDAITGAVLTFLNSGTPGEIIVLWATGLGADPADSDTIYSTTPHAVNTSLQVFIGGVAAQILYEGSAGYPGVNQINVVIPQNISQGCWVSVAAVANSTVSNVATLPIHAGGGPCVEPVSGLNGTQLWPSAGPSTFRSGFLSLFINDIPSGNNNSVRSIEYASTGAFVKYSGVTYDPANSVSPGGCILQPTEAPPIPGMTQLDAGTITLTGPSGLDVTMQHPFGLIGTYNATLPTITPATYKWKGTGGANVGSFESTLTLSNPLFTWTNPQVTSGVSKSSGLRVTWTGGNPGSYVIISGIAGQSGNGGQIRQAYFCMERVEAGQFTIPAYILSALPTGNYASTQLTNISYVPLTAEGLDLSSAFGSVGYTMNTTFAGAN